MSVEGFGVIVVLGTETNEDGEAMELANNITEATGWSILENGCLVVFKHNEAICTYASGVWLRVGLPKERIDAIPAPPLPIQVPQAYPHERGTAVYPGDVL